METVPLFLESAKEDSIAHFSQDQAHKHQCTWVMFSQLPYLKCQRYVKRLRQRSQTIPAVRINETLFSHAEKLSNNMETSLCFTCLFLTGAKLSMSFFPDRAKKKAFDCVERNVMWGAGLRNKLKWILRESPQARSSQRLSESTIVMGEIRSRNGRTPAT